MTKSDHLRNAGAVGTATALISLLIWVIHRFVRLHSCMFLQLFDSSILALNTGCVVAGDQGVTPRVHAADVCTHSGTADIPHRTRAFPAQQVISKLQ